MNQSETIAPSPRNADYSQAPRSAVRRRRRRLLAGAMRHGWPVALLFLGLDVVCWLGLYSVAGLIRDDTFYAVPAQYVGIELLQLAIIVQALFIIGGYNRETDMRALIYTTEHLLAIVGASAASVLVIYAAATFDQSMHPSRSVLLISFLLFAPLSLGYRRLVRGFVAASTANRAFLVVGSGELAAEFYRAYRTSPNRQRLEFVDLERERVGEHIAGAGSPIIEGDIATKLANLGDRYSGVILAERVDRVRPDLLDRLVRTQFHSARVYTLEGFYEAQWRHVPVNSIDPFWPLQMGFQLAKASPYHYLKRLVDLALSGVLLVICSPLLALIALLISWKDGRPVFFPQQRVGREGELFTIYKFRTMRGKKGEVRSADRGMEEVEGKGGRRNAEGGIEEAEKGGVGKGGMDEAGKGGMQSGDSGVLQSAIRDSQFAIPDAIPDDDIYTRENDPRVTPLGRWLRKLRLDELPQLWNVLRGDMSLIGPRAEWIRCAERYEKKIPFYHFRHLVKPGITGWAQVNYPYGESDEDAMEKLKYDLYYIRRYSLKLDAMIVLKTVHTMLFARGR